MADKRLLRGALVAILFTVFVTLTVRVVQVIYTDSSNSNEFGDDKRIKVGFSLGTLKEERWIKDRDILMAKVKEMGADIIVQNANNDDQDQLKQVRYLLGQDIDVLILVPNDHNKAVEAVELAKKNGVKVISYDRLVLNSNVDLYISFDNTRVGEIMAQYVLENSPVGSNILIVNGATSDHNTMMIKRGYDKVLKSKVAEGAASIIKEEWAPNWMKEYAFNITDELLREGAKIDAVIAGNDGLADGVIEALSLYRTAGNTLVVGQDADLVACQRIVEGTQHMTVYKPIEKLAGAAASMAIQLAKDGPLTNIVNTINDGTYNVPYYKLEPIPVNIHNLEETIIKDGFHMVDEIYRNNN
ncbi:substrate-binding domain-containing protein [Alkalicella caledoniensis]|uniref:Substrate-binding domain-containing protein n=1 Tax=Alkalicella caledoniensis TaxID=2731377 RepID=A0A7G9W5R4_ALKCA|nr:substrate-binding domain-containing protein [Alkalicella caledoniensis]QNO14026.1 substrate-binding domain-containing protein [Alkalicella caledoniensis]